MTVSSASTEKPRCKQRAYGQDASGESRAICIPIERSWTHDFCKKGEHTNARVNMRMRRPCGRTNVVEISAMLSLGLLLRSILRVYSNSLPSGACFRSILQMPAVKAVMYWPVTSSL